MKLKKDQIYTVKDIFDNMKTPCGICGENITHKETKGYLFISGGFQKPICEKCLEEVSGEED